MEEIRQQLAEAREALERETTLTEELRSEKVALEIKAAQAEEQIEGNNITCRHISINSFSPEYSNKKYTLCICISKSVNLNYATSIFFVSARGKLFILWACIFK